MKKQIALIISVCMLAFSLPIKANQYSDMPESDSRFYDAFVYAINKKLINGDGGALNPSSPITLAEAAVIIDRISPSTQPPDASLSISISPDAWYYSAIMNLYSRGIISLGEDGTINPGAVLSLKEAFTMLSKLYSYTPSQSLSSADCTRAEFIWEIYFRAPDGYSVTLSQNATVPSTPPGSESPSEPASEFSDLKAQAAREAMQLALGLNPDGSSYTNRVAYTDTFQTGWQSGSGSSSGSSRPTRPTSPSTPSKPDDEDDTQAPTKDDSEEDNLPIERPTEAPTEPETPEPTYSDYDGPVDNDKDNTIDDPFNDGWRPPGWIGGDDGDDDNSGGGWDDEDDDFNINDADDPDYKPDKPSSDATDEPSSDATDEPSSDVTDEPSSDATDEPSSDVTDEPSSDATDEPSSDATDEPSSDVTDEPSSDATDEPSSDKKEEDSSTGEAEDEDSTSSDNNSADESEKPAEAQALLLPKDWWFN